MEVRSWCVVEKVEEPGALGENVRAVRGVATSLEDDVAGRL